MAILTFLAFLIISSEVTFGYFKLFLIILCYI
jgi:uncharacterized membrane protein